MRSLALYKLDHGVQPARAAEEQNSDGTVTITLFDEENNVLDIYTIDPETGIGKDYSGSEIILPQKPVKAVFGDINGDGKISASDAQLVLQTYASLLSGDEPDLNDEQLANADVNRDEKVSALDAQLILSYYLNNSILDRPTTWEELIG